LVCKTHFIHRTTDPILLEAIKYSLDASKARGIFSSNIIKELSYSSTLKSRAALEENMIEERKTILEETPKLIG
jgi:hypothetical protein